MNVKIAFICMAVAAILALGASFAEAGGHGGGGVRVGIGIGIPLGGPMYQPYPYYYPRPYPYPYPYSYPYSYPYYYPPYPYGYYPAPAPVYAPPPPTYVQPAPYMPNPLRPRNNTTIRILRPQRIHHRRHRRCISPGRKWPRLRPLIQRGSPDIRRPRRNRITTSRRLCRLLPLSP